MTELPTLADKVAAFQDNYADEKLSFAAQARKLSANKRDFLYGIIQEAYVIGSELMLPENKDTLDILLKQHGLKQDARKGSNPWMAVTNLLFGSWETDRKAGTKTFVPDKSAKKYAPSFRYFARTNWEPETVASELKNFRLGKGTQRKKGLIATEILDRDYHRKEDPDQLAENERIRQFWAGGHGFMPAVAISDSILAGRIGSEGQLVAVWGVKVGNSILLYGTMPSKFDHSVEPQYKKAAKQALNWMDAYRAAKPSERQDVPVPTLVDENVWKPVRQAIDEETRREAEQATLAKEAVKDAKAADKPAKRPPAKTGVDVSGLKDWRPNKPEEGGEAIEQAA